MRILVLNTGSSSIKFAMYESDSVDTASSVRCLYDGEVNDIGEADASLSLQGYGPLQSVGRESAAKADTAAQAADLVLRIVCEPKMPAAQAVGHRVVHPGPKLHDHQRITPEVLLDLEAAIDLAPLHDPNAIEVIRAAMSCFPEVPHFACFDTVFHQTMPEYATVYAIPQLYRDQGIRRYGFHGLSCESIVRRMKMGGAKVPKRMVIAHLGSGCSVTAVLDGCSIDTTMGLTPSGGVVMGTRAGDLDPGLVLYLLRQLKTRSDEEIAELESMLNYLCGMVAISGTPNDVRAMRKAADAGNTDSLLALKVFTRSVTKAIGAFSWLLGGLDAIVFTGGVGEHDAFSREEILAGLEGLGISVDVSANAEKTASLRKISTPESKTSVFVITARENWIIALHVDQLSREQTV